VVLCRHHGAGDEGAAVLLAYCLETNPAHVWCCPMLVPRLLALGGLPRAAILAVTSCCLEPSFIRHCEYSQVIMYCTLLPSMTGHALIRVDGLKYDKAGKASEYSRFVTDCVTLDICKTGSL